MFMFYCIFIHPSMDTLLPHLGCCCGHGCISTGSALGFSLHVLIYGQCDRWKVILVGSLMTNCTQCFLLCSLPVAVCEFSY